MSARIKHVAFASNNAPRLAKFYESLFGMKRSKAAPPASADPEPVDATVGISDGNIGMVVIRRAPGFIAALDHFGIEVDDIESVCARIQNYPHVRAAKRPSYRSFAAYSGHDPAGNVFDLTQPNSENRRGIFVEAGRAQERSISHIAIRTLDPKSLAHFYVDVFGFSEAEKATNTSGHGPERKPSIDGIRKLCHSVVGGQNAGVYSGVLERLRQSQISQDS